MLKKWKGMTPSCSNTVYGLGLIGGIIYQIQHATSFVEGVVGVLKALVWPALFVYKVFETLK